MGWAGCYLRSIAHSPRTIRAKITRVTPTMTSMAGPCGIGSMRRGYPASTIGQA